MKRASVRADLFLDQISIVMFTRTRPSVHAACAQPGGWLTKTRNFITNKLQVMETWPKKYHVREIEVTNEN